MNGLQNSKSGVHICPDFYLLSIRCNLAVQASQIISMGKTKLENGISDNGYGFQFSPLVFPKSQVRFSEETV